MLVSATAYDSQGQDWYYKELDDPETNHGNAEGVDGDKSHSFFLNAVFNTFTLQGAYCAREKTIPTGAWETVFNEPGNSSTDISGYVNLNYEDTVSDQWAIATSLSWNRYEYDGDYLYDYADPGLPPDVVMFKDYALGQWWGAEFQVVNHMFETHKISLGGEFRNNYQQDQSAYTVNPSWTYLDDEQDTMTWAVYIQDEVSISDTVMLNAGVRYDYHEDINGNTSPRLALIYHPLEKTTIKLLYGEAFRAPNVYELYYHDGPESMKPNPDLEPEKIKTYEMVLEQALGQNLRGGLAGFFYQTEDLISQQVDPEDGMLIFDNVEKVEASGVELELEGQWVRGTKGRFSYTFQETKNQDTGESLTNSPKHLARANLIVPLIVAKVFANGEVQYTGQRKTLDGSDLDDFWVTNLTLFTQNVLKDLDASVSIYNLFDEDYGDPGSGEHAQNVIYQDGRNYRFKLMYRFW